EVSGMEPRKNARASHTLDKTIHHPLLAGFVELDRELVAVDRRDVAVAELLVKDAVADRELGDGASRLGDELAFDGERQAAARLAARTCPRAPSLSRCGPIHRFIAM